MPNNTNNQSANEIEVNILGYDLPIEILWHIFSYLNPNNLADPSNLAKILRLSSVGNAIVKEYIKQDNAFVPSIKDFIDNLVRTGIIITDCPYTNQTINLNETLANLYFYITKDPNDENAIHFIFNNANGETSHTFKFKLCLRNEDIRATIVDSTFQHLIGTCYDIKKSDDLLRHAHTLYRAIRTNSATQPNPLMGIFSVRSSPLSQLAFLCRQDDNGVCNPLTHFYVFGIDTNNEFRNYYDPNITYHLTVKQNDPIFVANVKNMINRQRLFLSCQPPNNENINDNNPRPIKMSKP